MLKIAVTGEIRTGKDTVCNYIKNLYNTDNVYILYFAEGIKEIIEKYFPESLEESEKPRKHYQDIGQCLREINPDVWVNYAKRRYDKALKSKPEVVLCTDLRQRNEYDWLVSEGFKVIKVDSELTNRIERMKKAGDSFTLESLNHPVERQIRELPYDYLVTNNGTLQELYLQVQDVLDDIKRGNDK